MSAKTIMSTNQFGSIMSGPLRPRAHYVRPIMSAAQYVRPIMSVSPLCPAHYVHGPIMSGPLCPQSLSGVSLAHSQGACKRLKKHRAWDCECRNHSRLYQSVSSLRSSVIESFIFLLKSRWKLLIKELLICVRFSLNDSQSQVHSFDLNNDVFDLKFSPLIAK